MREFSGPWEITARWSGGFTSVATARGHQIRFDQPGDLEADDGAPTPHEYLLSSIGGCLIAGVVMHATVRGVQLTALTVSVAGTFDNVLKWAGLDDAGTPGYGAVEVRAALSGEADDDTLRDIWDRAFAGSPVAQTTTRATPVVAVLDIH